MLNSMIWQPLVGYVLSQYIVSWLIFSFCQDIRTKIFLLSTNKFGSNYLAFIILDLLSPFGYL